METVTSKDGTRIAYDRAGQGPALILVDGALCYRGFGPMGALSAQLAPHFTVYAYDRRGRGESGDTPPYAIEREIEDLDALIRAAGGSANVYGISSGAALALHAAACGSNIRKLVMYEAPYVVDENIPRQPDDTPRRVAQMAPGEAVAFFMTQVVGGPPEMVEHMKQTPALPALEAVGRTVAYDLTIMGENHWYLPKGVGSVRVPVLVMTGGNSPAPMQLAAQALEDVLPNACRRTLAGQDHNVSAEVIAPALVEFFKS